MTGFFNDIQELPGRSELDERKRELAKYLKKRMYQFMREYEEPIKQKAFADKLGLSAPVFNAYVKGGRLPEYDTARRLSELFGTEILEICGYPEPMPNNPNLRAMAKVMPELPEPTQVWLVKLTEAVKNNPGLIDSFPQLT